MHTYSNSYVKSGYQIFDDVTSVAKFNSYAKDFYLRDDLDNSITDNCNRINMFVNSGRSSPATSTAADSRPNGSTLSTISETKLDDWKFLKSLSGGISSPASRDHGPPLLHTPTSDQRRKASISLPTDLVSFFSAAYSNMSISVNGQKRTVPSSSSSIATKNTETMSPLSLLLSSGSASEDDAGGKPAAQIPRTNSLSSPAKHLPVSMSYDSLTRLDTPSSPTVPARARSSLDSKGMFDTSSPSSPNTPSSMCATTAAAAAAASVQSPMSLVSATSDDSIPSSPILSYDHVNMDHAVDRPSTNYSLIADASLLAYIHSAYLRYDKIELI